MTEQEQIAELKIKFLEYYRELPIIRLASASIGRHEDTVHIWKKNDSEFSEQIEKAKAAWTMANVKVVRDKKWLLERIMRDDFAQRTEHTGAGGKDLPVPILSPVTNALHSDDSSTETPQAEKED